MEQVRTLCDGCGTILPDGSSVYTDAKVDLCGNCVKCAIQCYLTNRKRPLRLNCTKCKGKGTHRVVDEEASFAQATCGENRTQYKIEKCPQCVF